VTAAVEHSFVQFGHTRIAYGIRRSEKRRTIALTIVPDLGVVLTAPLSVSVARLDRLVHNKARWIVERLRAVAGVAPLAPREFVSGESIRYLGRQHRLRVLERIEPAPVRLDHGTFIVTVAPGRASASRAAAVRERLVAWFREHAEPRLRDRAEHWARQMGLRPPQVVLAAQQKRWGSCTANGLVRLNWRIVQAPMSLIDYVVAHELVHLRRHEHSPAFWRALAVVMPEYEARRQALRELGPGLEW
jgi:predicted metal-dependent hydrolase